MSENELPPLPFIGKYARGRYTEPDRQIEQRLDESLKKEAGWRENLGQVMSDPLGSLGEAFSGAMQGGKEMIFGKSQQAPKPRALPAPPPTPKPSGGPSAAAAGAGQALSGGAAPAAAAAVPKPQAKPKPQRPKPQPAKQGPGPAGTATQRQSAWSGDQLYK